MGSWDGWKETECSLEVLWGRKREGGMVGVYTRGDGSDGFCMIRNG